MNFVKGQGQTPGRRRVFGKGEDGTNMEPMLHGAKENLKVMGWEEPLKGRQISADTGY